MHFLWIKNELNIPVCGAKMTNMMYALVSMAILHQPQTSPNTLLQVQTSWTTDYCQLKKMTSKLTMLTLSAGIPPAHHPCQPSNGLCHWLNQLVPSSPAPQYINQIRQSWLTDFCCTNIIATFKCRRLPGHHMEREDCGLAHSQHHLEITEEQMVKCSRSVVEQMLAHYQSPIAHCCHMEEQILTFNSDVSKQAP